MGRRLGQHFLSDPAILDRIVEALEPQPRDLVLEIGAGTGTLTRRLAPRVGWVVALEKDRRLLERLRDEQAGLQTGHEPGAGARPRRPPLPANVTLVQGDALALEWPEIVRHSARFVATGPARPPSEPPGSVPGPAGRLPQAAYKVIGNIPYYIATPLIEKALSEPLPELVVFLVQRELAERLAAGPGSKAYGALSAGVQAEARVERLFVVPAGAFRPPPEVDSALVRLRPLAVPLVSAAERPAWRRFLKALFAERRKQLGHSLQRATGLERAAVAEQLRELGIAPAERPERLSPETLVALFRRLAG